MAMEGSSTQRAEDSDNYASEATSALLASDLLKTELENHERASQYGTWSLQLKGSGPALPGSLWRSGKVIGIAAVDGSPSIPSRILAHHLIHRSELPKRPNNGSGGVSAFVITQPNSAIVPSVYHHLQNTIDHSHEADAIKLLDSVQILQSLDLTGLSESLAEVSSSLYRLSVDVDTSCQPVVLHITSLTSYLSSHSSYASHASLIRSTAVLANLLRTLTHLSRTYCNLLVLVDLDAQVRRRAPSHQPQSRQGVQGHELHSGFASSTGAVLQLHASASNSIAQIAERCCDTIVAVHRPEQISPSRDGRDANEWIMEVVKDRVEGNLGFWQSWTAEDGAGPRR